MHMFLDTPLPHSERYVAHPEGRLPSAKLRAFTDCLRAAFGTLPYWEQGLAPAQGGALLPKAKPAPDNGVSLAPYNQPAMSTRVLSLLLTLSLLWSAFMATGLGVQSARAASPAQAVVAVSLHHPANVALADEAQQVALADPAQAPGGAPADTAFGEPLSQGLLEAAAEPVALFGHHPVTPTPPLTMARPRAPAVASWPAPDLDGPKRPPRPTTLVG